MARICRQTAVAQKSAAEREAAGYLNPGCYDVPLPAGYADAARELILDDLRSRARGDGLVELLFFRVYVLARRP